MQRCYDCWCTHTSREEGNLLNRDLFSIADVFSYLSPKISRCSSCTHYSPCSLKMEGKAVQDFKEKKKLAHI